MSVAVVATTVHDIPVVRRKTIFINSSVGCVIQIRQTHYVTELMAKRTYTSECAASLQLTGHGVVLDLFAAYFALAGGIGATLIINRR